MSESKNQRHAALSLHALAPRDRRWVLDRLAPAERAQLTPLLQDLRALNIPADAVRLPALQERPPGPEKVIDKVIEKASAATPPAALIRQLAGEAPFVVAACLLDLGVEQQQQVLARMDAGPARAVRDLMRSELAEAGALRQAVRSALQSRRAAPAPSQPSRHPWHEALRAWWPKLGRSTP